jgi:hypothetical protein
VSAEALALRATAILDKLPTTADEIAAFFRSEGIKGTRADACNCPVANYLKRELQVEERVLSEELELSFYRVVEVTLSPFDIEDYDNATLTPRNDGPHEFAVRFDKRGFPDLLDRGDD